MRQGGPPGDEEGAGLFACPCCGYKTLGERDAWEICPICFWEDDPVQHDSVDSPVGANHITLREAQRNFREFGAVERRLTRNVRKPTDSDERDPEFRFLDQLSGDA